MHKKENVPGDYIAGFIDGEGCFFLTYRSEVKYKRPGQPKYYRWQSYFAVTLREDDSAILEKIKNTLGCGKIYITVARKGNKQVRYGIQNIDDLYKIILPFFNKYQLRAKKLFDFKLWAEALEILYKVKKEKRSCTTEENKILFDLRNKMRQYKSSFNRGYKNNPRSITSDNVDYAT